jgi:hypothetical protein
VEKQMDLIKKTVMHKSFGQGTIIECSDSYVAVQFESGIKEFVYPDAFDRYLKLVDKKAADSVDKILEKLEMEREIEEQRIKEQKEMELEVVVGASGNAKTAVENYLKGELKTTGSVCHEHQHHDECGE